MSFPYYGKLWITTQKDLSDVQLREKLLRQIEPTRDRNYAHRLVGNIFARYIVLCNNLSELYDQTLQPQKRVVIEKILVSSTHRLLELRKEMQKIEMSEFVYLDDALKELKMTAQNIEFLRPFYFPRKRDVEIQQMIDGVSKTSDVIKVAEVPKGLDKFRKILTPEEIEEERQRKLLESAADLIKIYEKAKQQRVRTLNMKLFPKMFPLKPALNPFEASAVHYDFLHSPDQIPLHKVKRTNFSTNFYKQKINVKKFTYYEPPKYRINKLGHKVLVARKMSEVIDQQLPNNDDDSDSEEVAMAKKVEEENRRKVELEIQYEKQRVAAATVIQRSYRRHRLQQKSQRRNLKRMEMCGLAQKPDDREKPKQKEIEEKIRIKRRERKKEFDERLMNAIEDEKARILKMKSQFIMEDISDDIRQWFKEFYDGAKDFHRYPEEFEGGTIMVLRGETMTVEEFLIEKEKTAADKAKEKEARKKKKKEEKAEKKKRLAQEKKEGIARINLEKKQGPTWNFAEKKYESEHFDDLEKSFNDYRNNWQFVEEMSNRKETPIWDWVTIDAYADVHQELRIIVDGFMRIELELLRVALAVDNKSKYIPPTRKKPKKERKRKRKPSVDVTEGRSLDECFEELKSLNIIRKYPKRSLDEFIGDENFAATELRMMNKNPNHHYGDIKTTLRTSFLGMGPLDLPKSKSLCIAGPRNCGKKFLIEALCTELDAVMFDLSPAKVAPIPNMAEFLSLVMQMAKRLQPSVIFIDGAHKPFIKKIPQGESAENPKKIGFFLFKSVVKKLKKDDAIMLMGTTNQPWNCNYVQLRQCFEKVIILPPTLDYGTALMTWNKGLQLKRIYNFDASSLAQVTRTFTLGDILDFIDRYIDLKRRIQLPQKPVKCAELFEGLLTGQYAKKSLDEKTIESFQQFGLWVDTFFLERKTTMARVQVEIDKEKEAQKKKQEMLKKKKAQ